MVPDEQLVFTGSLTHDLWYNPTSTVRDNLNVVTGDFVDGGWLWDADRQHERGSHPARPPGDHRSHQRPRSGQRGVLRPRGPRDRAGHVLHGDRATRRRPDWSATGPGSPITVTGLTNGQEYEFR